MYVKLLAYSKHSINVKDDFYLEVQMAPQLVWGSVLICQRLFSFSTGNSMSCRSLCPWQTGTVGHPPTTCLARPSVLPQAVHGEFLVHVNLLLEAKASCGLPLESQWPAFSAWRGSARLREGQSQSLVHILRLLGWQTPAQSANRAAEARKKGEGLWGSCWNQRRQGTVFPEMNNARRGGKGGRRSPWAPGLFPARLPQSSKPPS